MAQRILFLTQDEVRRVVADLKDTRRAESLGSWENLTLFWLAVGTGLRRSEIAGLDLWHVDLGPEPMLRLPRGICKGKKKGRDVPLWINQETLDDIARWYQFRRGQGAGDHDPFVCSMKQDHRWHRFTGQQIARRWRTAIRCLGPERVKRLNHHAGRHTFGTQLHMAGYPLVVIKQWMGHESLRTTEVYLHAVVERRPDLYGRTGESNGT